MVDMRAAALKTASWRDLFPFDARMHCMNFLRWFSGTRLKAGV